MPASITLTVSHLPSSTSFFLSCLQPLNYVYRGRVNDTIGFGHPDAPPDFWITQSVPGVPPGPAHVAFPALSQRHVHEFFVNGLRAGGKVHGEPALRDITTGYYCAAIIDLDGNSIEAVYRADLAGRNRGSVDGTAKSTASMTKSTTNSKAPTIVSSVSKARKAKAMSATENKNPVASSAAGSATSKASSQARTATSSLAPSSSESRASRQGQRVALSASTISRVPTQARSVVSTTTPLSSASRAPLSAPRGDVIDNLLSDCKGTISMAKQLIDQARPHMLSSKSTKTHSSTDGHSPSDAIVGTLLGVAAGAALTYALSTHSRDDTPASVPVPGPGPAPATSRNYPRSGISRSETVPSYSEERYHYYYGHPEHQYAIEAAPSSYRGSQRFIEMIDNDPTMSEYTRTTRPRRRSSLSDIAATKTVTTRHSHRSNLPLEAPPTSYRPPTASTHLTHRTSHSRASSATRIPTTRQDEGYASASESRSRMSRHTSMSKKSTQPSTPSRASSHSRTSRHTSTSAKSTKSNTPSHHQSIVTAIKTPSQHPLPPSRAATWTGSTAGKDTQSFFSTHSKPSKTVIGKLTERQLSKLERNSGLECVTRSVVGKVKGLDEVDVSGRELEPSDSVSQVSSHRR